MSNPKSDLGGSGLCPEPRGLSLLVSRKIEKDGTEMPSSCKPKMALVSLLSVALSSILVKQVYYSISNDFNFTLFQKCT